VRSGAYITDSIIATLRATEFGAKATFKTPNGEDLATSLKISPNQYCIPQIEAWQTARYQVVSCLLLKYPEVMANVSRKLAYDAARLSGVSILEYRFASKAGNDNFIKLNALPSLQQALQRSSTSASGWTINFLDPTGKAASMALPSAAEVWTGQFHTRRCKKVFLMCESGLNTAWQRMARTKNSRRKRTPQASGCCASKPYRDATWSRSPLLHSI
jgi:hypothetical protein